MNIWDHLQTYATVNSTQNWSYKKAQRKKKRKQAKEKGRVIVQKFAVENRTKATEAELAFKDILNELDIKHRFQYIVQVGKKYRIADFFLPEYNTIVEIDGDYHLTEEQQQADLERTQSLLRKKRVQRILRLNNKQVLEEKEWSIKKLLVTICPPVARYINLTDVD